MLPAPDGTASCMNRPRLCTVRTASANVSTPAATSAEYSPRLCPASNVGFSPPLYRLGPRRHAMHQNGGLGVLRQPQLVFRPLKAQALQIVAQNLVGLLVQAPHIGIGLTEVLAHADEL